MKFFNNFFSTLHSRAYFKFSSNLFFLRHMLSLQMQHTLVPHFFLPTATLKIKFLNNTKHTAIYFLIYSLIFSLVLLSSLYVIL